MVLNKRRRPDLLWYFWMYLLNRMIYSPHGKIANLIGHRTHESIAEKKSDNHSKDHTIHGNSVELN